MPKKKILIIDDSRLSRSLLSRTLDSDTYEVDQAESGFKGLQLLQIQNYDCIYVDYEMPGLNGIEVIEKIVDLKLDRQPALILLTAHEGEKIYRDAMVAGADAYINKGLDFEYPSVELSDLILNVEREQQLKEEIARRIKIEAELVEAKQRAEASAKAKSEFLANMSHEIRTPMNGILGMSQILMDCKMEQTHKEYVRIILNSADALLAIINDILDFSKIEAGKLNIEYIPFDLQLCVEEVCDLMLSKIADKGLELIYRFVSGTPLNVVGDPGRIRQILTNFISNAVKFTAHGHVIVQVENVEHNDGKKWVRYSVTDSGIGIPKNKQALVFEKFTQADTSTTRKYGGTGLGLSICQQLIDLMGGVIGLESEEGKGSTFYFEIPMAIDMKPRMTIEDNNVLESSRILYVDDNEVNRKVFVEHCDTLKTKEVAVAHRGKEALELFRKKKNAGEPFDLVVIDQNMPEMSGVDVAVALKKEWPQENLRLMMFTSSGKRGDAQQMRDLGFMAYLVKPARRHVLLEILKMMKTTVEADLDETFLTRHNVREFEQKSANETSNVNLDKYALLVEDNRVNQQVALKMLSKMGVRCDIANDGLEAVELFQNNKYDVILMDCQMPNMDGYEATRTIRSLNHPQAKTIPILAMTAHSMEGSLDACLASGMNDHISKPIKVAKLLSEIKKWTQSRAPLSAIDEDEHVGHVQFTVDMVARSLNISHAETEVLLVEYYSELQRWMQLADNCQRQGLHVEMERVAEDMKECSSYLGFNLLSNTANELHEALIIYLQQKSESEAQRLRACYKTLILSIRTFIGDNQKTFSDLFKMQKSSTLE